MKNINLLHIFFFFWWLTLFFLGMELEQSTRGMMITHLGAYYTFPDIILMNGKGPLGNPMSKAYESFNVTQGTLS